MSEVIDYDDAIIMNALKREVCRKLGDETWNALVDGIGVPDIHNEARCGCRTMREFTARFDALTDNVTAKDILTHVRHGLEPSQFHWAKEKFGKCDHNIDVFIHSDRQEQVQNFTRLRDTGESFYGQPISDQVLDFVLGQAGLLSPVRNGSELHVTAFPYDMAAYIEETDKRKKRYHACHCPFARESILRENEEVSKTLCYCSLGHAKIMWEAVFNRELDGEVVESALAGDSMCKYVIYLPDDIVQKYT